MGAVLTKIFPIRILQMAGGMLAMLGIGLCSLATESWQVLVLFGIVAGRVLAVFCRINKLVDIHCLSISIMCIKSLICCDYFGNFMHKGRKLFDIKIPTFQT